MENYYFSPFPDLGFWGRGEDERRDPIEFFEKFLK